MLLGYDTSSKKGSGGKGMHLICRPFWCQQWCAGAIQTASPNLACPGLLRKPLDAGIGRYLLRITPATTWATGKQATINKYTNKAGHFDVHGDVAVRYCAHCPIEQVCHHWTSTHSNKHQSDKITSVVCGVFHCQIVEKGHKAKGWPLITIGGWHIKMMISTQLIWQNTYLGWLN